MLVFLQGDVIRVSMGRSRATSDESHHPTRHHSVEMDVLRSLSSIYPQPQSRLLTLPPEVLFAIIEAAALADPRFELTRFRSTCRFAALMIDASWASLAAHQRMELSIAGIAEIQKLTNVPSVAALVHTLEVTNFTPELPESTWDFLHTCPVGDEIVELVDDVDINGDAYDMILKLETGVNLDDAFLRTGQGVLELTKVLRSLPHLRSLSINHGGPCIDALRAHGWFSKAGDISKLASWVLSAIVMSGTALAELYMEYNVEPLSPHRGLPLSVLNQCAQKLDAFRGMRVLHLLLWVDIKRK